MSNFVGFFPFENPQLLGFIMLDEPKQPYHWGNEGAAVAFSSVMKRIINMDDGIAPPSKKQHKNLADANYNAVDIGEYISARTTINNFHNRITMPELRGLSIRKALHTLEEHDLKFRLKGNGKITWQNPSPGTIVQKGTVCTVGLQ